MTCWWGFAESGRIRDRRRSPRRVVWFVFSVLYGVSTVFANAGPNDVPATRETKGKPIPTRDVIVNVIEARVLTVKDGDTMAVAVEVWPDVVATTNVRVRGIDTPEKGWRAKCTTEANLSIQASNRAHQLVEQNGGVVYLADIQHGKYAGRVVATVYLADGVNLAGVLVNEGLAVPYDGGKKPSWCPEE